MLKPQITNPLRRVSAPHRSPCHNPSVRSGTPYRWYNGKSGERERSHTGEMVLCSDWLMIAVLTGDTCKLAFDTFKVVENAELVSEEKTLGRESRYD